MTKLKYGKKAARIDRRTLRFSKYFTALMPPPPSKDAWLPFLQWGMMKNDTAGDCVPAGAGHAIMGWTAFVFNTKVLTDDQIIQIYIAETAAECSCVGYNPNDGTNDNGCDMLSFLNRWHNLGLEGHFIAGFAALQLKNLDELKSAINIFGNAYIGINVPAYLENIFNTPDVAWDVPKAGDDTTSVGGHCIVFVKYDDATRLIHFVSWGQIYKMTYDAYEYLADEAYALLSPDFISTIYQNKSPRGFDLATLTADIAAISSEA